MLNILIHFPYTILQGRGKQVFYSYLNGEVVIMIRVSVFAACIIALVQCAIAADFSVRVDTGVVLQWQNKTGTWAAIRDSAMVGFTDSLFVDEKYGATLSLGKGASLLLKGDTRICFNGNDSSVNVYFDQGQIFLKRGEGAELKEIKIIARGCTFVPVGTAAAFKLTKAGDPSVAVLSGKIRMDSPSGQSIVVESGNFGTFLPSTGTFKQGSVAPDAIASLEKWSGVTEQPVVPAEPSKPQKQDIAAAPASGDAPIATTPTATAAPVFGNQPAATPVNTPVKETQAQTTPASSITPAATTSTDETGKTQAAEAKKEATVKESGAPHISWEVSAQSVTVGGKQWTRLAISPDIPVWKFGIGLDIECYLDEKGEFSQKGWEFDNDTWYKSVVSKIKYLRFGHENDPFFAKAGGLDNVTLGYGFIVDRFTNTLHYPDNKLLGIQMYLNDIGPIGVTLQTMTPDVMEFKDDGGIFAGRVAVRPLKPLNLPLLSKLSIGATYAIDINEYAPADSWKSLGWDKNNNGKVDWDYAYQKAKTASDSLVVKNAILAGLIDSTNTMYTKSYDSYSDSTKQYALLGGDIGLPIIQTGFLGLDVYGQGGVVADTNMFTGNRTGWGFGAPGARLTVGSVTVQAEYRHTRGRFTPGYFNTYYLDERLQRYPSPVVKSDSLDKADLDGVFGIIGANIFNLLIIEGSYQYMAGSGDNLDQRFEAKGNIGDAIIKWLPKISKVEAYFSKTDINRTVVVYKPKNSVPYPYLVDGKPVYDDFLEQTPTLHWGFRLGVEITKGASIIWDQRYGYKWDTNFMLVPDNNMIIGVSYTF
jgi:hypothetical protein